jgi:hypothetical protein
MVDSWEEENKRKRRMKRKNSLQLWGGEFIFFSFMRLLSSPLSIVFHSRFHTFSPLLPPPNHHFSSPTSFSSSSLSYSDRLASEFSDSLDHKSSSSFFLPCSLLASSDVSESAQFSTLKLFNRQPGEFSFSPRSYHYDCQETQNCQFNRVRTCLPLNFYQSYNLWRDLMTNTRLVNWSEIHNNSLIQQYLESSLTSACSIENIAKRVDLPVHLIRKLQRAKQFQASTRSFHSSSALFSSDSPMACRSSRYENEIHALLSSLGVRFVTEYFMKKFQKDQSGIPFVTPDVFLLDPIEFHDQTNKKTVRIRWMEIKSCFGSFFAHRPASVVSLNPSSGYQLAPTTRSFQDQILKYYSTFGPGLVLFSHGFCSSLSSRLVVPPDVPLLSHAQFLSVIQSLSNAS